MCLAIPLQVIRVSGASAAVQSAGVELEIRLDLIDGVAEGDWVIVHAGYAITRLEAHEARETLAILERLEASWQS